MRISDWSSDVCSSDLHGGGRFGRAYGHQIEVGQVARIGNFAECDAGKIQRAYPAGQKAYAHAARPAGHGSQGAVGMHIDLDLVPGRSAERPVGKECVSQCRFWWSPSHSKHTLKQSHIKNILYINNDK